jgi:hypothetical protein
MKSYETLQAMARKNTAFHSKINGMGVVQGELSSAGCARVGPYGLWQRVVWPWTEPLRDRYGLPVPYGDWFVGERLILSSEALL